jgi:ketosteroid isomerase-like protein
VAGNATAVVEEAFAALAAGDVARVGSLMAEDIRFSTGGSSPISGVAEGKEAVFEKMQKIGRLTGGTGRLELVRTLGVGDELVLAHATRHASANGEAVEANVAMVVRVANGAIVEVADVMERRLEDFWTHAAQSTP